MPLRHLTPYDGDQGKYGQVGQQQRHETPALAGQGGEAGKDRQTDRDREPERHGKPGLPGTAQLHQAVDRRPGQGDSEQRPKHHVAPAAAPPVGQQRGRQQGQQSGQTKDEVVRHGDYIIPSWPRR
jgi:hypothetical protein